ncbi:hypothetical protein HPB50_005573 [Hyalomma asiaticum]|uniref:Uncharacterized protein n=1 Tax=Hyalomma asiaticum TaxID=266040 RepID=A0ACB7SKK9_HYAAI|nr:hypothetical protein HPB50_005573 [Hyalomma asiaticum]
MASDRGVATKIGDMTADLEEMARRELGETPEVKAKCIEKLRRLLAEEPWLECPTDEEFLVKFLRARKYDVEESLKNIRKYFRVKQETREMFDNLNPYSVPFDAACREHRLVTVSRQRDSLGRGVVLLRLGAWNSGMCSLNDYFRVSLVQVEWLLFQQDVQIRGVVFVLDFKGLSVYHITQYTPYFMSKLLYLMQDCYPIRVKALYVIHNPALFDILFAAAKRFMKPKLLQRVRLLGHDLAKLHSLLPSDVIPKEAGGTHELYDYDKLEKDLQSKAKFFDDISRYGYRNKPGRHIVPMANTNAEIEIEALKQRKCSSDLAQQDVVETPELRRKTVKRLRELISGERHLHITADDELLLKFLRARKFDADRAFKVVKNYFKVRRDNPEMMNDLNPGSIPFDSACRKHGLVTVSRETDPDGRAAVILRFGAWNTDICSLNDYFRVCIVHAMYLTQQEQFQVKGLVAVLDLKGLSPYHVAHYTPSTIKKLFSLVQDCFPLRIKGVYIINSPVIFEFFFAIAKRFMKAKLVRRIRFFGNNIDKLHSLVPDDVIPEEHGGTNESYDYDVMEKDLLREEEFFRNLNSYGYRKKPRTRKDVSTECHV